MVLLALLVVAVLLLSAPMAEAKKKKKKRPAVPAYNMVECPNQADDYLCYGTDGNDRLVGRAGVTDSMLGWEGNDIYDGKGGQDHWTDYSEKSSDTYLVPAPPTSGYEFAWGLRDFGGSYDVLDIGHEDSTRVLSWSREDRTGDGFKEYLYISMPTKAIAIDNYFGSGAIEYIRFRDKILTPDQVEVLAS